MEQPDVSESRFTCSGCGYNLTGASIGGQCPECGTPVDESLRAPSTRTGGGAALAPLSYVGPVLATVFCCVIGGVIAIVYTAKANTAAAGGIHAEYASAKSKRDFWLVASILLTLLMVLLQIFVAGVG